MVLMLDQTGTIGSRPCELVLNKILDEIGDRHVVSAVMRKYNQFREGMTSLDQIQSLKHKRAMLDLWRNDHIDRLDRAQESMSLIRKDTLRKSWPGGKPLPDVVYRHLRCAMVACYRDTLRRFNDED